MKSRDAAATVDVKERSGRDGKVKGYNNIMRRRSDRCGMFQQKNIQGE